MKLTARQKAAFGIGAVGKDMVYALSSSYIMYYYQDILGLSASFVGLILMIARIFLLKPKILLADEPTSMIDACSRATILDMLLQLRDEIGMTVIFITHDIGLAYYISDSIYIMEHGKFVESGGADEVILHPQAPYTKRLISDVPKIHEVWDLSTV